MITVLFEVKPKTAYINDYLAIASNLKKVLNDYDGLLHSERFRSTSDAEKLLSLSEWESEEHAAKWRQDRTHRMGQIKGYETLFESYEISVISSEVVDSCKTVMLIHSTMDVTQSVVGLIAFEKFVSLTDGRTAWLLVWENLEQAMTWLDANPIDGDVRIGQYLRRYTKSYRIEAPEDSNDAILKDKS